MGDQLNMEVQKVMENEHFNCKECGETFILLQQLEKHRKIHTEEYPYVCDQCGKAYSLLTHLNDHIKRTHRNIKPYQCTACGYHCDRPETLRDHVNTHKSDKSYKCETCGKGFAQKSSLRAHNRIHTGEKPFKCSECPMVFAGYNSLKFHIMKDHRKSKPFECQYCKMCFRTANQLTLHVRTHTGEEPYECNVCLKRFAYSKSIREHLKLHMAENPHKCSKCMNIYPTMEAMKEHAETHSGKNKKYKCILCIKTFESEAFLQDHVKAHIKTHKCIHCNESFSKKTLLIEHIKREHSQNIHEYKEHVKMHENSNPDVVIIDGDTSDGENVDLFEKLDENSNDSYGTNTDENYEERPKQNDSTLTTTGGATDVEGHAKDVNTKEDVDQSQVRNEVQSLIAYPNINKVTQNQSHDKEIVNVKDNDLQVEDGFESEEYMDVEDNNGDKETLPLDGDTAMDPNGKYKCPWCPAAFSRRMILREHTKKHAHKLPFVCNVCGQGFAKKNYFNFHVKNHFSKQKSKNCNCSTCGKVFNTQGQLADHINSHTGNRPYICEYCGKGFAQNSTLITHRRIHTGEKPYKCTVCPQAFANQSAVRYHMRKHKGEKSFICEACGKGFFNPAHLTIHMRSHTGERPFECLICQKSYMCSRALAKHVKRKHEIENTWIKCPKCDEKFERYGDVKTHFETHTKEAKYSCSHCEQKFAKETLLQDHMWVEHRIMNENRCTICYENFETKEELTQHLDSGHEKEWYKCVLCPKMYSHETNLYKHIIECHSAENLPFACNQCDKRYKRKEDLGSHLRFHAGFTPFSCEFCGKCYTSRKVRNNHEKRHIAKGDIGKVTVDLIARLEKKHQSDSRFDPPTGEHDLQSNHSIGDDDGNSNQSEMAVGDTSNLSMAASDSLKHQSSENKKEEFVVEGMRRNERSRGSLVNKAEGFNLSGNGGDIFETKCSICYENFETKTELTQHMVSAHPERQYKCRSCPKTYKHGSSLSKHWKECHGHRPEKPYACEQCDKRYKHMPDLVSHLKVHAGLTPFSCEFCGLRFSSKRIRNDHERRHIAKKDKREVNVSTAARQEERNIGDSKFDLSTGELDVGSKNQSDITVAEGNLSHDNWMPFQCGFCDKKYKSKKDLLLHIKSHKGMTRLECQYCYQVFTSEVVLKEHEDTHMDHLGKYTDKGIGETGYHEKEGEDSTGFEDRLAGNVDNKSVKEEPMSDDEYGGVRMEAVSGGERGARGKGIKMEPMSGDDGAIDWTPGRFQNKDWTKQNYRDKGFMNDGTMVTYNSRFSNEGAASRKSNTSHHMRLRLTQGRRGSNIDIPSSESASGTSSRSESPALEPLKVETLLRFQEDDISNDGPSSSFSGISGSNQEVSVAMEMLDGKNEVTRGHSRSSTDHVTGHQDDLSSVGEDDFTDDVTETHDKLHATRNKQELENLMKYKCQICMESFMEFEEIEKHCSVHKLVVKEESGLNLKIQDVKSLSVDLRQAMDNGEDHEMSKLVENQFIDFRCEFCPIMFSSQELLKNHLLMHDGSGKSPSCLVCGVNFDELGALKQHLESHIQKGVNSRHTASSHLNKSIEREHRMLGNNASKTGFECNVCLQVFQNQNEFDIHVRTHADIIGNRRTSNDNGGGCHIRYECDTCHRVFRSQTGYLNHVKGHTNSEAAVEHLCTNCDEVFTDKKQVELHIKQCEIKNNTASTDSKVSVLGKLKYQLSTLDNPYHCKICGKGFVSRNFMIYHMKCHKKGRNFTCPKCDKNFTLKQTLRHHMNTHKGKTHNTQNRKKALH